MAGRRRRTKKKVAAVAVGEDRFEDLPDHVLELVLSFLSSKEAVQTSVLARCWHHIWKSVPSLRICDYDFDTVEEVNSFVNKLIELRDPTARLDECEIPYYDGGIHSWLQYAVSCRVKVLKLESFDPDKHGSIYNDSVISEHLTRLEFRHLIFEEDRPLDLSGCRALQVLDLHDCGINLVDFVCPNSLRHLRLFDLVCQPWNIRARISAPGLVTCELSGCRTLTPSFGSLPSLITASIRITPESDQCLAWTSPTGYCEGFCCKDYSSVLLEGLSGATHLELISEDVCEIFSRDLKWPPTFVHLKTVLLSDWCVTENFAGLIYFLKHSPILERLTLQLGPSEKSYSKMLESYTPSEHFFVSKHLKVVEIKFFKVKIAKICQIEKLLVTLGVTRETITIDEDFYHY
ncbi:unnamed protein product [Alopecurus aequalis]